MARRKADKLDDQIDEAWNRLASGVQVNMMDIPRIFESIRASVGSGKPLDEAVRDAIKAYRQN